MNYQRIYSEFITDRKNKILSESDYTERHHIIPKSLGGDNSTENLISLTARDHLFAHALLAKIHGGKMAYAYWMMTNGSSSYRARRNGLYVSIPSHVYSIAKKQRGKIITETMSGHNHYLFGKNRPDSVRKKISESLKKKYDAGYVSPTKGRIMTEEQKSNISKRTKEAYLNGMLHPMLGKKHTKEAREKISAAQTGIKNNNYGKPLREFHAKKIGQAQMGIKNHAADLRILQFKNDSGESFVGYRSEFIRTNGLCKANIGRLVNGVQKKHKGWVFVGEKSL